MSGPCLVLPEVLKFKLTGSLNRKIQTKSTNQPDCRRAYRVCNLHTILFYSCNPHLSLVALGYLCALCLSPRQFADRGDILKQISFPLPWSGKERGNGVFRNVSVKIGFFPAVTSRMLSTGKGTGQGSGEPKYRIDSPVTRKVIDQGES